MTKIYNISPGFLLAYRDSQGKTEIDLEEVFKKLSFEMGGDGKSITKDQLDTYIKKADSGSIRIDDSKLNALKKIQEHWDTISKGEDSITSEDMKDYSVLLLATMTGNFTETEIEDSKTSIQDSIYDFLMDYLHLTDKNDVKQSDLSNYLNELIADDASDNDSNSETIGVLTNMIASFSSSSTIETEA